MSYGVRESVVVNEELTMSFGFGPMMIVTPFEWLPRSMFATICTYATAAMNAKP